MTTLSAIWETMTADPKADFLVTPNRTIRYGTITALMQRMLGAYDARGATAGDRVLILTESEPVAIAAFLSAVLDGLVPVLLTSGTQSQRAKAVLDTATPAIIIADEKRASDPWAHGAMIVGEALPAPKKGLFGFGKKSEPETFGLDLPEGGRVPRLPGDISELAYILFTSGTTSAPSGVMLTRENMLANLGTLARLFRYGRDSRIFNDLALAHADGMVQGMLLAPYTGAALVRMGGFSVPTIEEWLNGIRTHRATHVVSVPTIWAMIDRYASHDDYFDAEECRYLLSSASKLDVTLWDRIESRFNCTMFNLYGLTETASTALYAGSLPEMGAHGTVGFPVDCEARIMDPEGGPATGDEGEIQLRGTNVFEGYWKDPGRTAESFTEDGWMHTGDLAKKHPDGSYEILARLKTVINSGGFLIRPDEIDEALLTHPAVAEAATVAFPDPDFDEVPITAVVLDGEADEAALTAHCFDLLEPMKVPKRILAVGSIPRGDAGKPQLTALRDMLAASLATESAAAPGDGGDLADDVLAIAAQVFRVEGETLSLTTTPDDVKAWDSFTQINLLMTTEERLGVRIPAAKVAAIRSLGHLVDAVAASRK